MSAAYGRLRDELSHACLRGLGEVAAALAGDDLAAVCRTFETWQAEARRPWPWLPGLCWKALEQLDVTFPAGDADAVLAGRLLVGAECDAAAAGRAIDALRRLPEPDTEESEPTRADADPVAAMRRQRLASAVDAFWLDYVATARTLSASVRAADRARADAVVTASRRRLEESAERIDALAAAVAASLPGAGGAALPAPAPPALQAKAREEVAVAAPPRPAGGHTEPLPPVTVPPRRPAPAGAEVAAPARAARPAAPLARPAAAAGAAPGRPRRPHDPDVEYVRVREHRYAPIVFLVGVSLAAIAWLVIIASSGA